jgi:hypothetical protein
MKNMATKFLKLLGLFWSFIFLFAVASSLEGLVLSYLWEWFVVPLGLRPVSILHAIGICVLLDFITYHYYDYKRSEEVGLAASLSYILIRPIVTMIVGAAVHYGMIL